MILDIINKKKDKLIKPPSKFIKSVIADLSGEELLNKGLAQLNAKIILKDFLSNLNISISEYIEKYLKKCYKLGRISEVFPREIIDAIEKVPHE